VKTIDFLCKQHACTEEALYSFGVHVHLKRYARWQEGHLAYKVCMVLLTVRMHGSMWHRKCYRSCMLQYARSLSIEVVVNFRACLRSELLKWIGWHLGSH